MISIYDWFGYEMTIKNRYRLIRETGFEGVLLWWSNGFGRDCFGQDDYRNGPQIAREAGLFVENIHAPVENQNSLWNNDLKGKALIDSYLECVKDCARYEIPTMVIHLPNDDHPHSLLGLDRMKRIAESAEKHCVNVALENLRNLSHLNYVFEQVDSQRIGFCYDCGHHYHDYPDEDLLSMYGSRLMAVHLHDNNGEHAEHGLPFDGTNDWHAIIKNIERTHYTGGVAIEAMNWAYEDLSAELFLQQAFERGRRLEALKISK